MPKVTFAKEPPKPSKPRAATSRTSKKKKEFKGNFVIGELRDFPKRSMAENEAERQAFFAKAWAQKAAREAAEARGEVFVPDWQRAAAREGKPLAKPAPAKPAPAKPSAAAERARLAALNAGSDSD